MSSADKIQVKKSADYLRFLSLMAIEKANSGHPGLPLGCAETGIILYRYILNINPKQPLWLNRDRFVLSAGHGSMLLYSLLSLSGFPLTLADIDNFRQWDSKTPGHPEYDRELGIETTTGPLGQGFANAVGQAIEGKVLASRFNCPEAELFNYTVFTLVGDGCMMEGINYEAAAIAGHLKLNNLVAIYDSNSITIDGSTDLTFSEDVAARYKSQGWDVLFADPEKPDDLLNTLESVKISGSKPKLVIIHTTIGAGLNKKKGTSSIHGAPAGIDELAYFIENSEIRDFFAQEFGNKAMTNRDLLKQALKEFVAEKKPLAKFKTAFDFMNENLEERQRKYQQWQDRLADFAKKQPELFRELESFVEFRLSEQLEKEILHYSEETPDATRNIMGRIINACAPFLPQLLGGNADLAGSTKAFIKGSSYISAADFSGRNMAFGIREHAMAAICNGLSLNRTLLTFSGTFFSFFDYMKPAVRLAALMKLKQLFIFSHDSIFLGEDGPTHQPVEHLNALRLIPDLATFRPANARETALAFHYFLTHNGPAAIVTSRQKIAPSAADANICSAATVETFSRGAYPVYYSTGNAKPDLVIAASGSELGVALDSARELEKEGKSAKVVSIPSLDLFSLAPEEYRSNLLESFNLPVFFIEAASHRAMIPFYHPNVHLIDIQNFGQSAPGSVLGEKFGFSLEKVVASILSTVKN